MPDLNAESPQPWEASIYLGGEWVSTSHVKPIPSPGLDIDLGTAGHAAPEDVAVAAERAKVAQQAWQEMPGYQRAAIMRGIAAKITEAQSDLDWWLRRETGSSHTKALFEIRGAASDYLDAAHVATEPSGMVLSSAYEAPMSTARRRPLGVVGIITPWNSPLLLATRVVAPALALGNAVLLKPDPQTPVSGGYLLAQLMEAAGLPAGLFHVLPGGPDVGQALIQDPRVAKVSFTGSTRAGRIIGEQAGALLKPASLELGGNNPLIVRHDADLTGAVAAGAFGSFFHQGQICFTPGRHLVHKSLVDAYVERLAARADSMVVGPTTDDATQVGPVINVAQLNQIQRIVDESVHAGARLVAGGHSEGLYFQPTVLTDVAPNMPAFTEEIFGPVAAITAFDTDDEAIQLANNTDYGLVASIITADIGTALRMTDEIHAGIIHINDQTVVRGGGAPVGGFGSSGNGGRAGRSINLDEWTTWQWVSLKYEPAKQPF